MLDHRNKPRSLRLNQPSGGPLGAATPDSAPTAASICLAGQSLELPLPAFADAGQQVSWSQVSGPEALPEVGADGIARIRIPAALVNTRIAYEVTPADSATPVHEVILWVSPDADCPAARAGLTQVVAEGELVLLNGHNTALPEGAHMSDIGWEWVQVSGPPVALSDPWSLTPVFRAPEGLVSSDVRLELRVTNGPDDGVSSVSSISILVCGAETSLAVIPATVQAPSAGDVVILQADVETSENVELNWNWTQVQGPPLLLEDPSSPTPRLHLPESWRNVSLAFEATVHDGRRTGAARIEFVVEADEAAPTVKIQSHTAVADRDCVALEATIDALAGDDWQIFWVQLDGPPVLLLDDTSSQDHSIFEGQRTRISKLHFVAPDVARTSLCFACVTSDGRQFAVDTLRVDVEADQESPTVDAGVARLVSQGAMVELEGRAHVPGGSPLRVLWRQVRGPRVALSNPTSLHPSFHAPSNRRGDSDPLPLAATLVFALHVFSAELESVDTVTIRVGDPEPLAPALAPFVRAVSAAERFQLCSRSTESLGQIEECKWRQISGPTVELMDANTPDAWFLAPEGYANTQITFEVEARWRGQRTLETVEVLLEEDEDAPMALVSADRQAQARELVRLEAFARDPSGQALTTCWRQVSGPPVALDDPRSWRPTFAAPVLARAETMEFEFRVTDGVATVVETVRVQVDASSCEGVAPALPTKKSDRRNARSTG